jgi:hypothetical protein
VKQRSSGRRFLPVADRTFVHARAHLQPPRLTSAAPGTGETAGPADPGTLAKSSIYSSLIAAAIASIFTIGYVANLLGEDEDWLHELSIEMFPEDGRLWVYGVDEDGVTAFTLHRIWHLEFASDRPRRTS